MTYDTNNIFAKILKGEIPCQKIFEDETTLAFRDIYPKAPIHILVIPKGPYRDIADFGQNASTKEIEGFYRAVSKIAHEHQLTVGGFRAIANAGGFAAQEVPHYHIHLLGGGKLGAMVGAANN